MRSIPKRYHEADISFFLELSITVTMIMCIWGLL